MHSKVEYVVAHGISTTINGRKAVIGSYHFVFEDEGAALPEGTKEPVREPAEEYSHLYLAIEGQLAAVICIEDPLREEAEAAYQFPAPLRHQEDRHDDGRQRADGKRHRKACRRGRVLFRGASGG